MSANTPTREVFQDVEPDPDAVLSGFGVDSPEELLATAAEPGDHEPTADEELDACDAVAAELFDDLETATLESSDATTPESPGVTGPAADLADDVFVSEPTVVVAEGDGAAIDVVVGGQRDDAATAEPSPDGSADDADEWGGLVGPDPDPVRVADDTFGAASTPEPVTDGGFVTAESAAIGGSAGVRDGGFRWVSSRRLGERSDPR